MGVSRRHGKLLKDDGVYSGINSGVSVWVKERGVRVRVIETPVR